MTEDPSREPRRQADAARVAARAASQQREQIRAILRDPEARRLLTSDPEFRSVVAEAVAAERRAQENEAELNRFLEAERRNREFAPHQASSRSDPWANDPMHAPAVVQALVRGAPPHEVQRLIAAEKAKQTLDRQRQQQHEGFMWETISGENLMADSAQSFPGVGVGLPPTPQDRYQRSVPLPDPERVSADREAGQ